MIRTWLLTALALTSYLSASSGNAQAAPGTSSGPMITGTITYRAKIALPPDAAIDVRLEDVTVADVPSKLVAENVFAAAGQQVPIPFQLPYAAADINPAHRYVVRANIKAGEKLMFTSTHTYPVLTQGAPNRVVMVLHAVSSQAAAAAPAPRVAPNALRGTKWILIELDGKPVTPSSTNPAYLLLDPIGKQYSGSSGCNRINGTFQLDGTDLQLLGGAMTLMACAEPLMKQEKEFNEALTATGSYRIAGGILELSERKKVLAKFCAAPTGSPSN